MDVIEGLFYFKSGGKIIDRGFSWGDGRVGSSAIEFYIIVEPLIIGKKMIFRNLETVVKIHGSVDMMMFEGVIFSGRRSFEGGNLYFFDIGVSIFLFDLS